MNRQNSSDARITCDRCHGIGYVSTELGKLRCLACSIAESAKPET